MVIPSVILKRGRTPSKRGRGLASQYGWATAVMGASETGATAYKKAGLSVLQLGDEAILRTREFNLNGRDMRPVRQAVTRVRRHGVTVRMRRHRDIPPEDMAAVIIRADDWRDTDTERGFSMALGRLGDHLDGDCLLVEAVMGEGTEDESVVGMLSLVPWGGPNGVSLDLMRRKPTAPNGVVELMVSELATRSDEIGVVRVSLNFAVFRSVFEEGSRIGAGPILRIWRSVLVFFSRWWQLEALYRSNVKYQPDWAPRFLCFEDNRELPRVGFASAIAEGFVVLPSFGRKSSQVVKHTGTHAAVPAALVTSEGLHADGSPPDSAPTFTTNGPRRPEQVRVRMNKLAQLADEGIAAYPRRLSTDAHDRGRSEVTGGTRVRIAGRLLRVRDYGGVVFTDVRDWSGDIQVLVDQDNVGREKLAEFAAEFDLGDLIEVSGTIGRSRKGELSLVAVEWRMNGKCLHPLPDKWKGLSDPETRVRQRYLDIALNPKARELLEARSDVVKSLRDSLGGRGYLEVETPPILQQVHGGANAAPFLTHINAYNLDLYLRIAPELYLKRLCVAGMEKVFEIGRVFRNEGVDFKHNPEFTILEAYEAHSDYEGMMQMCRELIQAAAVAAFGREIIMRPGPDGELVEVDISGEWPVKTMHGAVAEKLGVDVSPPETSLEDLQKLCDANEIPYQSSWDTGAIAQEMYEHLVEDYTEFPTFYTNFPHLDVAAHPAAPQHPRRREKWDLVAWGGVELGTAYSELTDPVDQRNRLTEQSMLAAGGDPEAMELDEDFLQALEHAMPPTGGLGMGVDRIVMLITGGSIRETLAFPPSRNRVSSPDSRVPELFHVKPPGEILQVGESDCMFLPRATAPSSSCAVGWRAIGSTGMTARVIFSRTTPSSASIARASGSASLLPKFRPSAAKLSGSATCSTFWD